MPPSGVLEIFCGGCGSKANLLMDHWLTPQELEAGAKEAVTHRRGCGHSAALGAPGIVAAPDRIRRFVADRMVMAPGDCVSMEALRDAYDDWPGNENTSAEYSTFGRWIRQAVPDGVTVERRRIGTERHNWIMGMRLG